MSDLFLSGVRGLVINDRLCIKNTREALFLAGIGILALATRTSVAMLFASWVFPQEHNSWHFGYEMGQIAASLASGNGFSWPAWSSYPEGATAWMPPVYPMIIATAFKSFGTYSDKAAISLIVFQATLSLLTCFLLYLVADRVFNSRVGLCAAFIFAVYPPAIHFSVQKIWSTSLFAFCMLLLIFVFLRVSDYPRAKSGIHLGILLGFTALVDPIIIGVYPFAFAWLYLKTEGNRRTTIKMLTTAIVAFFLTVSPWLVRNYLVFGRFVFIKSNFGHELYLGNRDGARGSYEDVKWDKIRLSAVDQEYLRHSDEVTRNAFLLRKAVTFIVEQPLSFAQRTMNRFVHYWTWPRPQPGLTGKVVLTFWLTVLVLAVAGLVLTGMKRRDVQLFLLFILLLPVPHYLTHIALFRYRFTVEPLLIIFAAYTLCRVSRLLRQTLIPTHQPSEL